MVLGHERNFNLLHAQINGGDYVTRRSIDLLVGLMRHQFCDGIRSATPLSECARSRQSLVNARATVRVVRAQTRFNSLYRPEAAPTGAKQMI